MVLKLNAIIDISGGVLPFDYTTDFRDLEVNFVRPFQKPVRVSGRVANEAGVLRLYATVSAVMEYDCMSCAEPCSIEYMLNVETVLVERLEYPEDIASSDIYVITDAQLDIDEAVRLSIILESDMVLYCDGCR